MITLSTVKFAVAGAVIGAVIRLATDLSDVPTVTPLPADTMAISELSANPPQEIAVAQASLK